MAGEVVKFGGEHAVTSAFAPRSFDDAWRMATAIAKSGLFGVKVPEQAFALMMLADAEGIHPVAAARDYHIIDGKPSLKADAMLARYLAAGGKVKWVKREDECCVAEFTHEASGTVQIKWDKDRATKAGIWGRNAWKTYPAQLLAARVISEGVRASYPSVLSGLYAPEEVIDFTPKSAAPHPPGAADAQDQTPEPTEAGAGDSDRPAPVSSSVKHSFTVDKNDDGIGRGKSAYAARKNGDWERVTDRLLEEMHQNATRPEALGWWSRVVTTDADYQSFPSDWRQAFKEEHFMPYLEDLPEIVGS